MALIDNLIAWWKLEEASGTRVDSHTSGYDLTDVNTVGQGTGKQGNCGDFERDNNECLYINDPFYIASAFSASFWVFIESDGSAANDQRLIDKWYTSSEYIIRLNGNPLKIQALFSCSGGTVIATGATSITIASGWNHIVVTYDTTNGAKIYLNGNTTPDGSAAAKGTVNNTTEPLTLGAARSSGGAISSPLDGLLDEVAIWDKVLSSTEITELYNSGAGITYEDLTGGSAYTQDIVEAATANDTIQRAVTKTFTEVATANDTAKKDTTKSFSENATAADSAATLVVKLQELLEAVGVSDTIQRNITKTYTEAVTAADTIIKATTKAFTEAVNAVASATAQTATYTQVLLESVNVTASLSKIVGYVRSFTETVSVRDYIIAKLNGINAFWSDIYTETADAWSDIYSATTDDWSDIYKDN